METHVQEEIKRGSSSVAMPKRLVQAYSQAPWRIATQRGVLFLIVAILGASILWVMVSVSVQAASAGMEIQQLEDEQEKLQREIAGRRTDIANQTSAVVMKERATVLGFQPIDPVETTYLVVPGFRGRESLINAPSTRTADEQPIIKPVYTQSLWEWLLQGILVIGESQSQFLPAGGTGP